MYALYHATISPPVYGAVRSHTHRAYVCFGLTCQLPPVSEQWYGSQCLECFTCAHNYCVGACDCCTRGSTNIVRESALKADSERKNPLLHWGLESASVLRLGFRCPVKQFFPRSQPSVHNILECLYSSRVQLHAPACFR